jgi:hypothetical protein
MPTLHGTLPDQPGPMRPCRWCGRPTDLAFAPEGTKVGPVPLHMLCSAAFIVAYERMKAGQMLTSRERDRLPRLLGHATASRRSPSQSTSAAEARSAPPER